MADDPTPPEGDQPAKGDPEPTKDPDSLGDGGKKALDAERKARRDAEKATTDLQKRLKEYEDRDKTDGEKAADALRAAEKRADEAEARALRLEVAADKGLTPVQAKRLVGSTKEELEADADEILEAFPASSATPPPTRTPAAKGSPRGGGDPTSEPTETRPAKLAADLPRY